MPFRLKITLCMLGVLSLLFGIGASLLISVSFQDSLTREQSITYDSYQMVIGTLQAVETVNGGLTEQDVVSTLDQIAEQGAPGWSALRLATTARTLYEQNAADIAETPSDRPAAGTCLLRYATTAQGAHVVVASGALDAGGDTLYLDMARDVTGLYETRAHQVHTFQWVFALMVCACAVLSYTIARLLTAPLVDLSRASKDIAAGRLSSRATMVSSDEIGLVARDFNAMAAVQEKTIAQLEEAATRQKQFMGSFAHEIKTPMTSIIGYADLIRGQTLDNDERAEAAHFIVSEGKRLEHLSATLLDLIVLDGENIELVEASPASIAQNLTARIRPIYENEGILLRCTAEEGACLLEPDLTASLLLNLLDNARKAMEGRSGAIEVGIAMTPDGCRIVVEDEGRGIPPEAAERVTEAFFRADPSRSRTQGGAGLGLALCAKIVALHNGSIRFKSREGAGTSVVVELKGGAA